MELIGTRNEDTKRIPQCHPSLELAVSSELLPDTLAGIWTGGLTFKLMVGRFQIYYSTPEKIVIFIIYLYI